MAITSVLPTSQIPENKPRAEAFTIVAKTDVFCSIRLRNTARFPLSYSHGDGGPCLSGEMFTQHNRLGGEESVV